MDQESLAQIKQIITEATTAVETRLGERIDGVQRHAEVVETRLGERIDGIQRQAEVVETRLREEIRSSQQQTEGRLGDRIDNLQQHTATVESRLREEMQDVKRHTGVLVEHLGHKIELLAEGHQSIHHKIEQVRSELRSDIHQESEDTRALLSTSYQELRQRVDILEQHP